MRSAPPIRRFVARGGSLIATGESTLYNEWGDPRPDFALGGPAPRARARRKPARRRRRRAAPRPAHVPAAASRIPGARLRSQERQGTGCHRRAPPVARRASKRPTSFRSAARCRRCASMRARSCRSRWSRSSRSIHRKPPGCASPIAAFPALVVSEAAGGGRVAYLAADLDRRYLPRPAARSRRTCWRTWYAGPPGIAFPLPCRAPG